MVNVEVVSKPITGSEWVMLDDGSVLFVTNVFINGEPIVCVDPEWQEFIKNTKEGDVFIRERSLVELDLDGFVTITFRHLDDDSYRFLMSLGVDHWAEGSTQEEMTVFVQSFNVNVVEPSMA